MPLLSEKLGHHSARIENLDRFDLIAESKQSFRLIAQPYQLSIYVTIL